MCSEFLFMNRIAKRKIRIEKIELEIIMSDIAIKVEGALRLIFFAVIVFLVLSCH